MSWRPEYGWPWFVWRSALVTGAAALLGLAVLRGGGADRAGELALDPTATREVELDPRAQAELRGLLPAGEDEAARTDDRSPDSDPDDAADSDDGEHDIDIDTEDSDD